jgi:hypothetical protein
MRRGGGEVYLPSYFAEARIEPIQALMRAVDQSSRE